MDPLITDEFRSFEIHCRSMARQARSESERDEWLALAAAWARTQVPESPETLGLTDTAVSANSPLVRASGHLHSEPPRD